MINKLVLRTPLAHRCKIATLERILFVLHGLKRIGQLAGTTVVLLVLVQVVYPRQLTRPFVQLDNARVGFWSNGKLTDYLRHSVTNRSYTLAIPSHTYKLKPAALGIAVDIRATTAAARGYSLKERLVPFSLLASPRLTDSKTVNQTQLRAGLQQFALARGQDPEDATLAKRDGIYSGVVPGKLGYAVDVTGLKTRLLATATGSRVTVPRRTVQPKITEAMLTGALDSWRQQTSQPITLQLGVQRVVIPVTTLQTWAEVTPDQKQDSVLVTYDTVAIKNWLNSYASRVYVAPKPATQYVEDETVAKTVPGVDGTSLDIDKSAAVITTTLQTPGTAARLVSASLQPVAFTTQTVHSYSPTSQGLQLLMNKWAAGYKPGTVAASFQQIGGQGWSASLNSNQQFFTASIYKLFVVDYVYHLMETGRLSPNTLVLGAGKSVDACLEVTIVVSDNTCPEALGDQLGWLNVQAYAQQQGFTSTAIVDHNWSTNTHDVSAYLGKLSAGSLMNASDTAALLNKMQRQVYRSAIPAGSVGSVVQDKVGFYGPYWHDAAIVHSPKATYILVVFTNGPGAGAIKNLAAQVQQDVNQ
jgi:beta-lactamase class A